MLFRQQKNHGKSKQTKKRRVGFVLLISGLFFAASVTAVQAILVVDSQLKDKPIFSAKNKTLLKKGERVNIEQRQRGWYQIKRSNQQVGWITLLQVRFESKHKARSSSDISKIISLRKGHSNVTATTGVRGIGENDIKNAKANFSALENAKRYKATELEAKKYASKVSLKSQKIKYQGD